MKTMDESPRTFGELAGHLADDLNKLAEIEKLCRANAHPGVNVGAHRLANLVLQIIERR